MQRERQILSLLEAGDKTIPEIVAAAYPGLDPRLTIAAGGSVFAHLLDLEWRETELDVHADILVSLQNPTVVGWRETLLCLVRPTHLV